ncbi:flagellar protein FlgN [Paenibacillus peoriae]|uniref:flagellar protein FlgN n=2 Tax=Paenibacillus TaxID=44249 RepID=UPI00026C5F8F|nr:flagellar protein FlgN [Paenibacillus peoriae]MEC0183502.1 flagellar protein FlgN [Paenibacillus peoriae]
MPLERLIDVLEQLREAHEQLIALGTQKKEALISNKVDQLILVMNQESKLSRHIEQLDERRMQVVYEFLQERGIKSKLNLNITELSRLVFDLEDKQRLMQIQKKLANTLEELKKLNELNQQLIHQALSYIDFSIESMSYYAESEPVYQRPADKSTSTVRAGLFDTRA